VKRTLLVTFGLLAVIGALIVVTAWEPWKSREREHEIAWLEAYAAWAERIDTGLSGGDHVPATGCEASYESAVGDPPARLAEAERIILSGCRRLRSAIAESDLYAGSAEWDVVRGQVIADLTDRRARVAEPDAAPKLAVMATPLAGARPDVLCWSDRHWEELSEEWRLIRVDELWPIGFADLEGGRIHLAPQICRPLDRFFGGNYAPYLNEESLDLAVALVTLAHEAEHLRSPRATEAEVECVALQRVRDLVSEEGRPDSYVNLMAGLALDVSYPDLPPDYRTDQCHDGSDLDVRPETSAWP
jgi:hypothetical protein